MKSLASKYLLAFCCLVFLTNTELHSTDEVEHLYADNHGVRIHYVVQGSGPLVVFIHGFPDFWYSWHHQMDGLKDSYRVVALDNRGYNLSDQPENQEDYDMSLLVQDVIAVISAEGKSKATIVGHDWGGAIAWSLALFAPQVVERLIIVNLPHPIGFSRELANNPEQYANSAYARNFQKEGSHLALTPNMLASFVSNDEEKRAKYVEAFKRSNIRAMMDYYRQNYPTEPYTEITGSFPRISVPVLQFHGLEDSALHHHGLNNTWEWVDADYSLVTIPDAGHWAHHDSPDIVTQTMRSWLKMRD